MSAAGAPRIGIVAARFNAAMCDRLVEGAAGCLEEHGLAADSIDVWRVPGAWELPVAVARWARSGRYDAIVAIGAIVRGETAHFEVIAHASATALQQVAVATGIPVSNAVLTVDTMGQAVERSGGDAGNKGREAALAALEMAAGEAPST